MREVLRKIRFPAPYVMDEPASLAKAYPDNSDAIAAALSNLPPPVVCISCGARRQTNGEMPCEH